MSPRSAAVAACLFLSGPALPAQTFDPIPPEQVVGRRLIAPEANFSIEAPGDRWAWTVAAIPNGRMYACRRLSDNLSFAVIHRADGHERMTEQTFRTFLDGAIEALQEEGFSVSTMTRRDAVQPFPGSVHFRASLNEEIDSVNRLVGFAGARGDLYALTALVGNDVDERLFTEFARSFRLLQGGPGLPPRLTVGLMILVALLVPLAWWGFASLAKWGVDRRLSTIVAAVLVALILLWVAFALRS